MADNNPDIDVIIIGAGLSGLAAAHLLVNAGAEIRVLEAADRVGGRVHSVFDQASGETLADLGPTWVWPVYQPMISKWLQRLNIETFDQFEDGNAVLDFDENAQPRFQPLPGQHGIKRISGGPQALVNALYKQLPQATVQTASPASAIEVSGNGVAVTIGDRAVKNPTIQRAARVIVALPLRLAARSITWSPPLDSDKRKEMELTPTWMATHAKAVALYSRPFWREKGLSGRIASQIGPLMEVHDHSSVADGQAALFGFIGWPHTMRAAHPKDLLKQINSQLVRCFGDEGGRYSRLYIEDWAENQWICSDLDLSTPPAHLEIVSDKLRAPLYDHRVYFSVAETALQSPGLIEGAFAAAEETVRNLLDDMKRDEQ